VAKRLFSAMLMSVVGLVSGAAAAVVAPSAVSPAAAQAAVTPQPSSAYWMAAANGSVLAFGAPALGSVAGLGLTRPVVGMTATSTGQGYWLAASDGAVFSFGDAAFFGSTGGTRLNRPVVGMAASPTGRGYWLVASDGGVFAFGDAAFFGSTGAVRLNRPIVGMMASPTGRGYWLVASDGGVFAFGDATFLGSTGAVQLNRPIVGMMASSTGSGYWLVASDGGVFAFGDATFFGSAGAVQLNRPIVGMAASPSNGGYTLVASDGGVFTYGDARFAGSAAGRSLVAPVVGMAVDPAPRLFARTQHGYDISFPQCGKTYPSLPFDIAIVGVNGGKAFTTNPCLVDQATRWATPDKLDVYLNLNRPPPGYPSACPTTDRACLAQTFGRDAAQASIATARSVGLQPRLWWLDIETLNTWDPDTSLNALTIQGAVDALQEAGLAVGIYGTRYQWGLITGAYTTRTPLPLWAAGSMPLQRCNEPFAGGFVVLSQVIGQYTATGFDEDYAC